LKVRKTVKIFRKSALKMETLSRYAGSEITLVIDTKTRWNSLLSMLERILLLKDAVQKAMIDLRETCLLLESEFELIADVVKCNN